MGKGDSYTFRETSDKWYDVGGWAETLTRYAGHFFLDMMPYFIGRNVRGEN